jgi:nitroreductase
MDDYFHFLELVAKRQSVRSYKNLPVEKEKIMRCIEAVRLAPSACNSQPWTFIIVDNPELKNQVADLTSTQIMGINHFTKQAPVHVVLVMENPNLTSKVGEVIWDKPYTLIDSGIAAIQFCLQATVEGLGTCILGWFNEKKVKKLLNIPSSKRAVLIITLGYPANDEIRPKHRKQIDEIFRINKYSN